MIKQGLLIVLLLLIVDISAAWSARADHGVILLAKAEFTIERAIKRVKKQYSGKVLKVEEIKSKGPKVFKVKVLMPGGRVKNVFVDAETGDVFEP